MPQSGRNSIIASGLFPEESISQDSQFFWLVLISQKPWLSAPIISPFINKPAAPVIPSSLNTHYTSSHARRDYWAGNNVARLAQYCSEARPITTAKQPHLYILPFEHLYVFLHPISFYGTDYPKKIIALALCPSQLLCAGSTRHLQSRAPPHSWEQ